MATADARDAVPLSHYLWVLKRYRWKMTAFVAGVVLAVLVLSVRATPIYESTATIDVDRRVPAGILGQEAVQYPTADADQFLATQLKLIQSDSVLRPVASKYHLFPDDAEAPVATRATPGANGAALALKSLSVARPPNTYLLQVSYRSPDPQQAADVANAIANSYILHTYDIRFRSSANLAAFMEKQLEELRAKMELSGEALARFERELNVINPEGRTNILSARLLQLNQDYTAAQTDRLRREAAYGSVRDGDIEAAQVSSQGASLSRLIDKLTDASEKFADVKSRYGTNHPEYARASAQVTQLRQQLAEARESVKRRVAIEYKDALQREEMLSSAVANTKAEYDSLNSRSVQYQALKREAEADRKLYEELVTRIKEAGINAGFQNSAIRIADPARPAETPVSPNLKLNLSLALLSALLVAVGVAVISDVLDSTIRDPEQARRLFGADVIGSLPLVKQWRGRTFAVASRTALPGPASGTPPLVPAAPSIFREAVRTLHSSIMLGAMDQALKSILVTSALPGEGKTTIAVHLAITNARQRRKTLLIDGDLRRPGVSRMLRLSSDKGLAAALSNGMLWRERLVRLNGIDDLDILLAGSGAHRAVDLVGPGLATILDQAADEYDLVVVDAPPLLGFPEPLQVAASVDGVVVVTLAGQTGRSAVSATMAALHRLRVNIVGLVLNEITQEMTEAYHGYGYYGKYYRHYRTES